MTQQPYNVILSNNTASLKEWQDQERCWEVLYKDSTLSAGLNLLTIKVRYVTGVILDACESVTILLSKEHLMMKTCFPAYVLFASAIDLLGRCILGASTERNNSKNLLTGLKWLHTPSVPAFESVGTNDILVTTQNGPHTIHGLFHLRNFSAHGQALNMSVRLHAGYPPSNRPANCPVDDFDYNMLAELPLIIGNAIEAYLTELRTNDDMALSLARAGVTPYRSRPLLDSSWDYDGAADAYAFAIADALRKMDWTNKTTVELFDRLGHTRGY